MYLMPLLRLTSIMVHVSGRITFGALVPARNLLTFACIHSVVVCQSQSHTSKVSKRSWRYKVPKKIGKFMVKVTFCVPNIFFSEGGWVGSQL